jgi:hypothetical protein
MPDGHKLKHSERPHTKKRRRIRRIGRLSLARPRPLTLLVRRPELSCGELTFSHVYGSRDSRGSSCNLPSHSEEWKHSLSSLRGTQRFECVCCLAATAPAPSSRGPPLPVSARSRKSLQTITPITGAVSGAGPRFECLQTKRCAYLWFARYPCSIFHPLGSRLLIMICDNSVVASPR